MWAMIIHKITYSLNLIIVKQKIIKKIYNVYYTSRLLSKKRHNPLKVFFFNWSFVFTFKQTTILWFPLPTFPWKEKFSLGKCGTKLYLSLTFMNPQANLLKNMSHLKREVVNCWWNIKINIQTTKQKLCKRFENTIKCYTQI